MIELIMWAIAGFGSGVAVADLAILFIKGGVE